MSASEVLGMPGDDSKIYSLLMSPRISITQECLVLSTAIHLIWPRHGHRMWKVGSVVPVSLFLRLPLRMIAKVCISNVFIIQILYVFRTFVDDCMYVLWLTACIDEPVPRTSTTSSQGWGWQAAGFTPVLHDFDESMSGIWKDVDIIAESTESDIFLHFFDATLIGNICAETNTNFSYLAENNVPPKSRLRRWHPVAVSEMYTLLATVMLMNHTKKYETTLYWSMNLILQTPVFSKIISCNRFHLLMRMLYFDSSVQTAGDKIRKF